MRPLTPLAQAFAREWAIQAKQATGEPNNPVAVVVYDAEGANFQENGGKDAFGIEHSWAVGTFEACDGTMTLKVPHGLCIITARSAADLLQRANATRNDVKRGCTLDLFHLMNEFKYVRGTLSKLRKRDIARVLLRNPTAIVSKRARDRVKDVFLDEINDGGLPLLNEFLLRFGHPGVKYVLELCADEERHPVAFYCTAGKDRTGIIAAIILSVLGVPDEAIVEDYSLSANVYAEMNDHKAMVGALSQRNLDPKTFLGAPPDVMRVTLEAIRENYGDVEGYLDFIGFGPEKRAQLKKALITWRLAHVTCEGLLGLRASPLKKVVSSRKSASAMFRGTSLSCC